MTDSQVARVEPREAALDLVLTRADGTVINLGRVAFYSRNPLRRLWWRHVGQRLADRRIRAANATAKES